MRIQDSVIDTIGNILKTKFGFNESFQEEMLYVPLTSSRFKLSGIQLYQLLMCIEEAFDIFFEPEDISENGFFTLADIQKSVEAKLHM